MYPEYTGTAYEVVLKQHSLKDPRKVYSAVRSAYARDFHLQWLDPIGFNNTYALAMRQDEARRLRITTISDLAKQSRKLTAGLDPEFLERPDGWPGLARTYGLKFASNPRQLDPGIVYRAVANGDVDVVDTYSTDGRIPAFRLVILQDDKHFFPPYYAAPVIRDEVLKKHPELKQVLNKLAGEIDEGEMQRLNYEVDQKQKRPKDVAMDFLKRKGLL
jgi:glycine betaine/choline ABC-type transport system substrate-binding protein